MPKAGNLLLTKPQAACLIALRSLPNPPDLRSLPAAAYFYSAADHCSRSATFPEACCSSNLLEPSSLCNLTRFLVNEFFARHDPFQQVLSRAFRMSYRQKTWIACV